MKGRVSRYFVIASFVLSVIIVAALGFVGVHASEDDSEEKASQPDGPLVVPIYPRFQQDSEDKARKLPEGADLRDSYIVLEDGSVISVADWILGSLHKNDVGAGMSDYQNRLFLGQVARSMAGPHQAVALPVTAGRKAMRRFSLSGSFLKPCGKTRGTSGK